MPPHVTMADSVGNGDCEKRILSLAVSVLYNIVYMSCNCPREESGIIFKGGVARMLLISIVYGSFAPAVMTQVFSTFVATGGVLTARRVFTVLSLVLSLRTYAAGLGTRAFFTISEGFVAVNRLEVGHVTILL